MSRRSPSRARRLTALALSPLAAVAVGGTATAAAAPATAGTATSGTPATVTLGAVDTYTGLKFTVPAGRDDLGQPQSCTIDADLYKPHAASRSARSENRSMVRPS